MVEVSMQSLQRTQHQLGKKDLEALAELIRETGLSVEETRYDIDGDVLKVTVGDEIIFVSIGYNLFMATGRIPGLRMSFLGHGPWDFYIVL